MKGSPKYDLPNASINFGSLGDLISGNIRGISKYISVN
jgi:hypothetical protein